MKSKASLFPLSLILASSAMAGQFVWTGATDSNWATASNWDIISAPPVSTDTYPNYGSTYASDFLNIRNNGDLTTLVPGTTPGAGAVYDPGAGVTTNFNSGRGFAIGTGNGPAATPANVKGYASLTITSGTIAVTRVTNFGSEPYMANRADVNLLINGGHLDLSGHVNNFRLIQEGFPGITSTITLSSGALSCRVLDLLFDAEADPSTVFGAGVINLDGGVFTVSRFIRSAAAEPGQSSSTVNLNGGTLKTFAAIASPNFFLPPLPDTQVFVKTGGALIDSNNVANTISAALLHDPALGASLDGGLTKNSKGNLTLSGTNTFNGGITINAGASIANGDQSRVILGNDSAAGTGTITLADSYSELQIGGGRNITNPLVVSDTGDEKTLLFVNTPGSTCSGTITINETNTDHFRVRSDADRFLTLAGKISGPGGIYKFQQGWVTLTNDTNDFTGGVKINQGILNFSTGALGTTGAVTMDGGTLRWAPGNTEDISSRLVMVDGKTAIFSTVESVALANPIGNLTTANLEKSGGGTLILSGTNTYTGTTKVLGGTLLVNGSLDAASAVTVTGGNLGGTGTVGGSVTVEAAGNIAPGVTAGTLSISGGLDVSAMAADAGKLKFELGADTATSDQIAVGGTLTIGAGGFGFEDFDFTNLGGLQIGTYTLITSAGIDGTLDAVPANLSSTIGSFSGTLAISGNNIVLNVTAGASGFAAWQTANGTAGGLDDDHDNDGVSNGIEYFLFGSANSTGFTALPGVTNTAGVLSVTWTKAEDYDGEYPGDFVVETSETLATGSWSNEAAPGTVTVTGNEVKYTFPAGTKRFARLKVTGP